MKNRSGERQPGPKQTESVAGHQITGRPDSHDLDRPDEDQVAGPGEQTSDHGKWHESGDITESEIAHEQEHQARGQGSHRHHDQHGVDRVRPHHGGCDRSSAEPENRRAGVLNACVHAGEAAADGEHIATTAEAANPNPIPIGSASSSDPSKISDIRAMQSSELTIASTSPVPTVAGSRPSVKSPRRSSLRHLRRGDRPASSEYDIAGP